MDIASDIDNMMYLQAFVHTFYVCVCICLQNTNGINC